MTPGDLKMREVALGTGLRILLGVLGAAAIIAAGAVGVAEAWRAMRFTPWPASVVVLFCVVVICGGALLVRGALRGTIAVRDPSGRSSRQRR
ncbi:MAG TPA: hypothetical protein VF488_04320 [Gemmatimonadaceae bacterium]